MTQGPQQGDHTNHRPETSEGQKDRAEKTKDKADHKSSHEADHGMEKHNKSVVEHVQEKRKTRKSGVTDKFNENQKGAKKVASADDLLPLEDPNKPHKPGKPNEAPTQHHKTESPGQHHTAEALPQDKHEMSAEARNIMIGLAGQMVMQTAKHQIDTVVDNGTKFVTGMGKGMQEAVTDVTNSVGVAADYYGKALTGKTNIGADAQQFGKAVSDSTGQALNTAADYYLHKVPSGQNDIGKDIGQASKAAADHWNSLDWEQKGHVIGKDVAPLAVPGAIGIVAKDAQVANLVSKGGEAISELVNTERLANIENKFNQLQGHLEKINEILGRKPATALAGDGVTGQLELPGNKARELVNEMSPYYEGNKKNPITEIQAAEKAGMTRNELRAARKTPEGLKELEEKGIFVVDRSYEATFFKAHPELKGKVVVHHAIEQQVLEQYPGLFTPKEINALENLRGIKKGFHDDKVHKSWIREKWTTFYEDHPPGVATKKDFYNMRDEIDRAFGQKCFLPKKDK